MSSPKRCAGCCAAPRPAVRHGQAGRHRPGRPPAPGHQAGEVPRLRLRLLRRPDGRGADEELARIPSDAEPASEFRYRNPVVDPDTLYVAVRQSGETRDTLMAVQELRRKGGQVIGAVNVVGSAIGRESGTGCSCTPARRSAVCSTRR